MSKKVVDQYAMQQDCSVIDQTDLKIDKADVGPFLSKNAPKLLPKTCQGGACGGSPRMPLYLARKLNEQQEGLRERSKGVKGVDRLISMTIG
jgi:hypothetical protein